MAKRPRQRHNAAMKYSSLRKIATVFIVLAVASGCAPQDAADSDVPNVRSLPLAAAAGSMGSNLISGPDGSIVLSWIEPDGEGNALRHSSLVNGAWSKPRTVVSGENWFVNWADFPSVVPLSETLWAAHWLVSQESGGYAYDVRTAISEDAGATWSESIIPHTDGTDTEHGFVTIFPDNGNIGMVWLDGRKMVNEYDENDVRSSGMTLRSASISRQMAVLNEALVDDLTCDCCQTDVALTAEGPVAIYRDRTVDETRDIFVSRRIDGEWQPGTPVNNDHWDIAACPVNGPVIQAHGSTVVVAWFTAAGDQPMVKVAWSDDSGQTFGAPIEVAADHPKGHVGAALLADGSLAVSWLRSTGMGGAELLLARISRSGEMSTPHVLSEAADVFAFSVPQISRSGDQLVLAWTTEVDKSYGVASALVPVSILTAD
jgi:hypothetical protein